MSLNFEKKRSEPEHDVEKDINQDSKREKGWSAERNATRQYEQLTDNSAIGQVKELYKKWRTDSSKNSSEALSEKHLESSSLNNGKELSLKRRVMLNGAIGAIAAFYIVGRTMGAEAAVIPGNHLERSPYASNSDSFLDKFATKDAFTQNFPKLAEELEKLQGDEKGQQLQKRDITSTITSSDTQQATPTRTITETVTQTTIEHAEEAEKDSSYIKGWRDAALALIPVTLGVFTVTNALWMKRMNNLSRGSGGENIAMNIHANARS